MLTHSCHREVMRDHNNANAQNNLGMKGYANDAKEKYGNALLLNRLLTVSIVIVQGETC